MKNGKKIIAIILAILAAMLLPVASMAKTATGRKDGKFYLQMLNLHALLDHSLEMIAEGSNIVIFSGNNITPQLDEMTLEHGRKMIKEGKAIVRKILKGPEMRQMLKSGHGNDHAVGQLRKLCIAELEFANLAEKLDEGGQARPEWRKARHIRVMIDHTLVMSAQGSDLVITGRMGMTHLNSYSIEHGRMMLFDSRSLLSSIIGMELTKASGSNNEMAQTVAAGKAAGRIIDLMNKIAGEDGTMLTSR